MNCKQGDLAIVVRSYAGNEGKIVKCLKLYPAGSFSIPEIYGPVWDVGGEFRRGNPQTGEVYTFKHGGMPDSFLRPLRGDLSNDEVDTETPIILETEKC